MSIEHSAIADPNIHEPKGVAAAAVNTVYASNGAGSGAWAKIDSNKIDTTSITTWIQGLINAASLTFTKVFWVHTQIADISTASSVIVPVPESCTINGATLVLGGAIATADATISFKNAAAASLGTAVTVAFTSSAKGDTYSFTATTNTALTGPTWVEIATDGASTNTVTLDITLKFTIPSA